LFQNLQNCEKIKRSVEKKSEEVLRSQVNHDPSWVDPIVQVLWKEKRKGVFLWSVAVSPKARTKS